ncbi:hypothetical protein KX928_04835 [Roseobacter sp. YSTF-M11]|uniref:Uncharacterized protein n=1 Tax=Roseobacter insulae TaxID=2859783 RepID=A0A9X1FT16_9RHOB|nr:hypothetical protein [Roseobacter insulae]MBW4707107.1 hypothetical protein [Roseobacter insulae]
MRMILAFLCGATPSQAWEFTPGFPCRLTHAEASVEVVLTFDPTRPLYSITLTLPTRWPEADVFGLRFTGPAGRTLSTDRHRLSDDDRAVTVTDTGFGNVLDGLQFNGTATALLGDRAVSVSLKGAAEPVAAFRRCALPAGV